MMSFVRIVIARHTLAVVLALCLVTAERVPQLCAQTTGAFEQVSFPSLDGLVVTADLYGSGDRSAPTAVLFHQSVSSRGEYRSIAPRIAELGYNVLAVDLRWGGTDRWNRVANETAMQNGTGRIVEAAEAGDASEVWPTIFHAYDDMLASLDWLAAGEFTGPTIVVGSSFSAMMALRIPGDRAVDGVVAFSPGEYYPADSTLAGTWASTVEVPVLIVGGPDEAGLVEPIHRALASSVRKRVIANDGRHGASILFDSDGTWHQLAHFLNAFAAPQEVEFEAGDGVKVFADWYDAPTAVGHTRPTALLFHQGGADVRSEYARTIPTLRMLGFRVLAVDLRRGGTRFGGTNRTVAALEARDVDASSFSYCDAYADVDAALAEVAGRAGDAPIVVIGSSFSAALSIQLAARNPDRVDAVLAFSPASGGPMEGCQPHQFAADLAVPTMVVRPAPEIHYGTVNEQLQQFRELGLSTYVAANGVHGSSLLNPLRVTGSVNANWQTVLDFLHQHVDFGW